MSGKSLSTILTPGNVVAGKFRVERVLGKGGMGLIVAATHLQLEKPVALKFFRGDLGVDREAAERFLREARAAAQLRSEHVARVLDVGVTEDEIPYIVMEYLKGQPLDEIVGERGPLEVQNAVEIGIQVCEGLAEAHARGIIHRDIKPANLFLVEPSPGWLSAKILDFGISKIASMTATTTASAGHASGGSANDVVGTPCYMSPEQLQAPATIDQRTDIWSLGASLHELLAGTPPFDPELERSALTNAIRSEPAPPLRALRREIPPGLEAVVARCLEKDRTARFDNAADLALALLPYAPARAHVPAERAAAMAKGEGLTAEVIAAPARPTRNTPTPVPTNGEAAQRASNRTTNTITSRGIGTLATESPDAFSDSASARPLRGGDRLHPATSETRGATNGHSDDPMSPITATLPASPGEHTPNLKPPILSKSLAVGAGVILALASGSLVLSWVGKSGSSRQDTVVAVPLRPPAPPSPSIAPQPPEQPEPEPDPVAVPAEARVAPAPVRPVAQVVPQAGPPAAEVPKIAIGLPSADATGRNRYLRATNPSRRVVGPPGQPQPRDPRQNALATSDAPLAPKPGRRAPALGSTTAGAAPGTAATPVSRKTSLAVRPTSSPTELPPAARPLEEVDPAGGRVPQRPILTRNPYEAQ